MKLRKGKLEIAFLVAVAIWLALLVVPSFVLFRTVAFLAALALALAVFARHWRQAVEKILWRLRNRLIVTYLLIGLVPVVLLSGVIVVAGKIVLGQMSVHVLTSQLDLRTAMLHGVLRLLASGTPRTAAELWQEVPPDVSARYPGLEIVDVSDAGRKHWPADSTLEPPPASWPENDGLVFRDGVVYGWAHVAQNGHNITATFPLTRDFLGDIAPNLGDSIIVDARSGPNAGRSLHPNIPRRAGTQNRLPPAVNAFDSEIGWFAQMEIPMWDSPQQNVDATLGLRTRVSAVMRTINPQGQREDLSFYYLLTIGALFLIAELISLLVGVSMTRTITRAVHNLYDGTLRVRSGDFSHRISTQGNDQLTELGASFNQMTSNVERLLQVEKERQRIQLDLDLAREVQDQLYPRTVPETDALRITAARIPARQVSGDYYDFQKLANGDVAVVIADVAGKGISAALLMATLQSSFRLELRGSLEMGASASGSAAVCTTVSPAAVSQHLNKHLYEFTAAEKYATFFCSVFDQSTSVLAYTNAGHLPPIHVRDGSCTRLEVNGMVVGAFPFAEYGEDRVEMRPGDLLVLFTDGITEPENEYGEMFGEERLADLVTRNSDLDDARLVDEIMNAVRQWTGSDELQDDMTLVLVRRR